MFTEGDRTADPEGPHDPGTPIPELMTFDAGSKARSNFGAVSDPSEATFLD